MGLSTPLVCSDLAILQDLCLKCQNPVTWLLPEDAIKMPLEECCFGTFTHQLLIFAGFSPSQGKAREEEVKTAGGEFSYCTSHLVDNNQNPPGF